MRTTQPQGAAGHETMANLAGKGFGALRAAAGVANPTVRLPQSAVAWVARSSITACPSAACHPACWTSRLARPSAVRPEWRHVDHTRAAALPLPRRREYGVSLELGLLLSWAIDEAATMITWEFCSSHGAHDEDGLMHAPWHSKLQRPRNS